jgi:hypothetical protein
MRYAGVTDVLGRATSVSRSTLCGAAGRAQANPNVSAITIATRPAPHLIPSIYNCGAHTGPIFTMGVAFLADGATIVELGDAQLAGYPRPIWPQSSSSA